MPRIVLKDLENERTHTVPDTEATIGRDPSCSVVLEGPSTKVVSGHHARVFFQDDSWWVEDTSRNGTILDDERLRKGERYAIKVGQTLGLGDTGPRLRVLTLEARRIAETVLEPGVGGDVPVPPGTVALKQAGSAPPPPAKPAVPPPRNLEAATAAMRKSEALRAGLDLSRFEEATEPMGPAPDWIVHLVLRETHTNQRWDVRADVIRIGRSGECLIQVPADQGASVSRVHAQIAIQDGGITITDAGSRNGTFVNGKRLDAGHEARKSDLIMLGAGGPTFSIEDLRIVKGSQTPTPPKGPGSGGHATPSSNPKQLGTLASGERPPAGFGRSFGGVGRTAFFKNVLEDMSQKNARRVRVIVWTSVLATVAIAASLLGMTQQRVSASERRIAAERASYEARADSIRGAAAAEAGRLRAAFDSARLASAPRAVVDSLRDALADAARRTGVLEVALMRAKLSLEQQLAAGETARRHAEDEMTRLRAEVRSAQTAGSAALLDSLRLALRDAEHRAADIASQLFAVRTSNSDLAQVAQLNQNAVGLVTMYHDTAGSEGSGFAITPSGYFVTNRHVVMTDSGRLADSVFVTMADHRYGNWLRADVIQVGQGETDIAVLRLRHYRGPYIKKVDWTSRNARQGEPAALIGFPRGTMMALDSADTVRTSMTAGIFSKITSNRVQFDGFSQGGSSGSPVFSASGEVVAVHFGGLRGVAGMGFAVPVSRVLPLLPADARSELGIR